MGKARLRRSYGPVSWNNQGGRIVVCGREHLYLAGHLLPRFLPFFLSRSQKMHLHPQQIQHSFGSLVLILNSPNL